MIHVFIGTKAQYIKTAPLLRLMDEAGVAYRLIDSGQHGELSVSMRRELGVREPDVLLGGDRDVSTIPQAIGWALGLARRLLSPSWLRSEVFGGAGGVCVVHGDTPSTLLSTFMAQRAGLAVAHLEAGLASHRLLHPFPEELIRRIVMRRADVLFAPDDTAAANLATMKVKGRVVRLGGNTSVEAVRHVGELSEGVGPAIVTMHRVENLHRASRRNRFIDVVEELAGMVDGVRFLVHEPTRAALDDESFARLESAGVEISPLVPHDEFVRLLAAAPLVVTDGGSIQEECALLGVPTLLWRDRTERPDGLDANVVLSHYDAGIVREVLQDPERLRRPARDITVRPSEQILEVLKSWR